MIIKTIYRKPASYILVTNEVNGNIIQYQLKGYYDGYELSRLMETNCIGIWKIKYKS